LPLRQEFITERPASRTRRRWERGHLARRERREARKEETPPIDVKWRRQFYSRFALNAGGTPAPPGENRGLPGACDFDRTAARVSSFSVQRKDLEL
jgi:hypothetical protein